LLRWRWSVIGESNSGADKGVLHPLEHHAEATDTRPLHTKWLRGPGPEQGELATTKGPSAVTPKAFIISRNSTPRSPKRDITYPNRT